MGTQILVVEDDTTARMLLADVLHGAGYTISIAPDGETALQLIATHQYSVVVTDIRMRDIDGIGVLKATRNCDIPPAVILLTGYGSLETAVAAIRTGAFDYLVKPVAPQDLLKRVARAAEHYAKDVRQHSAVRIIEQGLAQLQGIATPPPSPIAASPHVSSNTTAATNNGTPINKRERFIRVGALRIDSYRHTALFDGQTLHLTPIEFLLLSCLATSCGCVMSYQDIVRCSHGHEVDEAEAQSLLKAHIRNLRRKIGSDYLVNVRGTGYMLVDPTVEAV